jgi:hypothetical protein
VISFRVGAHSVSQAPIVEILIDGRVVSVIYPENENRIRIVSAHFKGVGKQDGSFTDHVQLDDGSNSNPPIPAISIIFEPGRYEIVGRRIVRLSK